jgi:exodeoxyribonuclease VIII
MIDLETMSVLPTAAIVQIGATTFCPLTGRALAAISINVDVESCRAKGLATDVSTVEWWAQPAQREALETMRDNAQDVYSALVQFRNWMLFDTDKEDIEVWANGAAFDLAILANAYDAVDIPIPWKFFNERCYRTVKSLYRDVPKPAFEGVKHNAYADSVHQARHLMAIMKEHKLCQE